ncbi:high nitrogen upregulated cytochrome P450 monooxygenase 2 [Dichomitus squalens]|uniref:High nitrogen upregulated cytochrome P450 monooxygenase 2 n=1 Tax=Dichomitus squalens TaxID=114155 RepID=A0A4Q9PHT4_9APHY|nr:high nitrogen upregulated cytochrome P450 monooxygenase 2 [Dichomitus squalens]TBU53321.1 high nitrogen upregulated cytochrome P450 monooxygenase 2 [Dichomitus squalens]
MGFQVLGGLVFLALIAHQIFKRYETYSIRAHLALLLGPPVLASALLPSSYTSIHAPLLCHLTYLGALSAFVILYRLAPWHPLARYPGPPGAKLSKWWMACVSLSGYEHLYIHKLHEKYGDVVRFGPNELSIRSASAANPIMATAAGVPKGPQYVGRMLSESDANLPLIGVQNVDEHLRRRRPWNRAFSATAVKGYEETIARRGRQLVDALERQKGVGEVVLGKWFNFFAYDFMCDMAFGGGSELLRDGDDANVWKVLDEGMVAGTFLGHVPWLGVYLSHIPAAVAPLHTLISHCKALTSKRIQNVSSRRDLFHYLNNEDLPEKGVVPLRQLTDDGCLAVVAGADTTSSTMTSLFYCLLTHPEAYERLQIEVDKFYPAGEDVADSKHLADMEYLNAVINETLRLYPPVPTGSQRQVPRESQGATVDSIFLPPGTSVTVQAFSVHRDPRNFFPHPDTFWPDRWLFASSSSSSSSPSLSAPETFVHNVDAFIPFALGPMNCVGKNLALQEIRMVVCAVMQRLEFSLREGWNPEEYERGFKAHLVASRPAVPVIVRTRA